jgi:uncharacterized protein
MPIIPRAGATLKRVLRVALFALPVAWIAAAVVLSEGAVRIPEQYRKGRLAEGAAAVLDRDSNTRLLGWITEPNPPESWNGNAVLLLHGVGDTHRGTRGLANLLAKHGYRTLSPDSRGHGASGGDLITYGLREREDVRAWVQWMDERWEPANVFGMGMSMGAAILLQSLPVEPRLQAVVAECPFVTFREVAYYRVQQAGGLFLYTRLRYGVDLSLASPESGYRNSRTPVLLIHGDADVNIPADHSRQLFQARPVHSELWIVPNANHFDNWKMAGPAYEERVLGWFRRHARSRIPH